MTCSAILSSRSTLPGLDPTASPSFLVIAAGGRGRRLATKLQSHAHTYVVGSVPEAGRLLRSRRRWCGWWVIDPDDERRLAALWGLQPRHDKPPVMLCSDDPRGRDESLFPHRRLPRAVSPAEERWFLGYCLAYEVTRRTLVAAAVENLGREHALTTRQMELAAVATLCLDRSEMMRGMGITTNTLKTRVRQLLRITQHDTLDALGKHILRQGVDLAQEVSASHGSPMRARSVALRGTLPHERHAALPGPERPGLLLEEPATRASARDEEGYGQQPGRSPRSASLGAAC